MSGAQRRISTRPARTADWSSATRTRIGCAGAPVGRSPRSPVPSERQLDPHPPDPPSGRFPAGLERAAQQGDRSRIPTRPAPEPGARGPWRVRRTGCVTVTVSEHVRGRRRRDPDLAGCRVLEGVGERLLDDAVRGELDGRGHAAGRRRRVSSRRRSGRCSRRRAGLGEQRAEPVEGGRRGRLASPPALGPATARSDGAFRPDPARCSPGSPRAPHGSPPGRRGTARRWSGWRWRTGGWRPCRAARAPSWSVRRRRPAAVHLGQQGGLLGAQPGGLRGVPVVADDHAGPGRREGAHGDGDASVRTCGSCRKRGEHDVASTVAAPVDRGCGGRRPDCRREPPRRSGR